MKFLATRMGLRSLSPFSLWHNSKSKQVIPRVLLHILKYFRTFAMKCGVLDQEGVTPLFICNKQYDRF
jgi:hypothetical protein